MTRMLMCAAIGLIGLAGCQSVERHPSTETAVDPDRKSLTAVDIGIAQPAITSGDELVLGPLLRDEARNVLVDKLYTVIKNAVVDVSGATSNGGPETARVVDADLVLLISVTQWDRSELISRSMVWASGRFVAYAKKDGRRYFEHAFNDLQVFAPGQTSVVNSEETERQIARTLVRQALASFPVKLAR